MDYVSPFQRIRQSGRTPCEPLAADEGLEGCERCCDAETGRPSGPSRADLDRRVSCYVCGDVTCAYCETTCEGCGVQCCPQCLNTNRGCGVTCLECDLADGFPMKGHALSADTGGARHPGGYASYNPRVLPVRFSGFAEDL